MKRFGRRKAQKRQEFREIIHRYIGMNVSIRGVYAMIAALRGTAQSKWKNRKTVVDGITFDSAKEARQWRLLKQIESLGEITKLRRQVAYKLEVNGVFVCAYRADFVYWDVREQREVVADAKGFRTPEYKLKRKLMKAIHGIEIKEM